MDPWQFPSELADELAEHALHGAAGKRLAAKDELFNFIVASVSALPLDRLIGFKRHLSNALGIMPGRRYFRKKASHKYSGASQKITEAEIYRDLGSWIRTCDEPGERANGMCADTGLQYVCLRLLM